MAYVAALAAATGRIMRVLRRRAERTRTRRIVEAMPEGLRKDIGWSTGACDRREGLSER